MTAAAPRRVAGRHGAEELVQRSGGAVVFRGTPAGPRFLLLRNVKGHWDFPKGRMEPGERLEQTIRREAREETGLRRLAFVPGFARRLRWTYRERGRVVRKIAEFRLARAASGAVRVSREHSASRWVGVGDGVRLLAFRNARALLRAAARRARQHAPGKAAGAR